MVLGLSMSQSIFPSFDSSKLKGRVPLKFLKGSDGISSDRH